MSTTVLVPEIALASTTQVLLAIFTLAGLIIWRRPIFGKGQADLNLALRYCTFIVIAAVIVASAYAGTITFALLIALLVVCSTGELFEMARSAKGPSAAPHVMALSVFTLDALIVIAACLTASQPGAMALHVSSDTMVPIFYVMPALSVVCVFGTSMISSKLVLGTRVNPLAIWLPLFGSLYVAWFLAHLVLLRGLDCGFGACIFLIACVALNDTCALAFGRLFGRHQLCKTISPNKTWEGLAGGFCGTFLAATLFRFELSNVSVVAVVSLAVLIACMSPVGDLVVSIVKRHFNAQESGKLLPGHGGLLDRFDSLILAAPAFYYALLLLR